MMTTKKAIVCLASLFCTMWASAQEKEIKGFSDSNVIVAPVDEPTKDRPADYIYTQVEVQPEFPGGMRAFYQYVDKEFESPKEPINGNIIVTLVVEVDGSLTNIQVIRDLGVGTKEATEKLLKASPKWKPAIQNGKPVRARFSMPIKITSKE